MGFTNIGNTMQINTPANVALTSTVKATHFFFITEMFTRQFRKYDYVFIACDKSTNVYVIFDDYMIAWQKLNSWTFSNYEYYVVKSKTIKMYI